VTISTRGEKASAFVPASLPPRPPIVWATEFHSKFDQAWLSLGGRAKQNRFTQLKNFLFPELLVEH
jgi:hypothetical protein